MLTAQSCLTPCDTMRTVARQAPLSMEFSRQEYWSVLALIPFSRGSSWPRDQTQVSCNAGRFFTLQADSFHSWVWAKKSFPLATGSDFAYYNSSERKEDLASRQGQRSNTRKTALLRTLNTYWAVPKITPTLPSVLRTVVSSLIQVV